MMAGALSSSCVEIRDHAGSGPAPTRTHSVGWPWRIIGTAHAHSIDPALSTDAVADVPADDLNVPPLSLSWSVLGPLVLFVLGFLAVTAWLIIRAARGDTLAHLMGSRRLRLLVATALGALVALVLTLAWAVYQHNRGRILEVVGSNLQTVLGSTVDRLRLWTAEQEQQVARLGRDPDLVALTRGLLGLPRDQIAREATSAFADMRRFFEDEGRWLPSEGFAILALDGTAVGATEDMDLLPEERIVEQNPVAFGLAVGGEPILVPPIWSNSPEGVADAREDPRGGPSAPLMFFAAPVVDAYGTVLAVVTRRENPAGTFSRILETGRVGASGQTYAFNRAGIIVSRTRFPEDLERLGYRVSAESGLARVDVRASSPVPALCFGTSDSGELTPMARSALDGRSGLDLCGYQDYRGQQVMGAWMMDPHLGLGIATEIDVAEALGPVVTLRNTMIGILALTLSLSVGAVGVMLLLGERSSRALAKARDELETRVEERTGELAVTSARLRLALETMSNGLFVLDGKQNYVMSNDVYEKALQLPKNLVGPGTSAERVIRFLAERGDYGPIDSIDAWVAQRLRMLQMPDGHVLEIRPPNGRVLEVHTRRAASEMTVVVVNDITQLKQKERDLIRSGERLELALAGGNLGFWDVNLNTGETIVNDRYLDMLGYRGDKVSDIRALWLGTMHPDDRARVLKLGEAYRAGACESYEVEYRVRTKSGEERRVESKGAIVERDGRGHAARMVGTVMDITDRWCAEQAIRMAEERTRMILDSAGEGIVGVDDQGCTTFVNPAACRMLGYAVEDLIGRSLHALIQHSGEDGHVLAEEDCPMRRALTVAEVCRATGEVFWRVDGTSFPVEYTATPILKDGRAIGTVVTFSDVTERRAAEEALRDSQQLLQSVIDNSGAVIFAKDIDGRYTLVNKLWEDMVGVGRDLVVGRTDFEVFPGPVASNLREGDLQVIAAGVPMTSEETFVRPLGDRIFLVTKVPLFDPDGIVDGLCGISTEITQRKQMEVDLMTAKERAESATRAKSAFLATMSHEIRTPLNGVVGMIDLLAETDMDGEQRQMLRTVRESAFALLQIINDVLDFSKIEAGKMSLEIVPVSVRDVVEGVAETLEQSAHSKGLRLTLFVDPALPARVLADQVRLRQILFNLMGNAIKFTDPNPDRPGVVHVRADLGGTVTGSVVPVRFQIIDNGIGMTPETVTKLFRPFTQAESSTTRRFGGTGLGLTICRCLTDLMKGRIAVDSVDGKGSTFTVTVPLTISLDRGGSDDEPDLTGVRVLLVGRDPILFESLPVYVLSRGGEPVDRADLFTAVMAYRRAARAGGPPDIVVFCPEYSAYETDAVIDLLRAEAAAATASVRFVVVTDDRSVRKGMVSPEMVVLGATPLKRSAFLRALGVACGRASPEADEAADRLTRGVTDVPPVGEPVHQEPLILVVEDNPTNQDVIRRQLRALGYACVVADNGREGLATWREGRFVLVLTDCHMPEMDGYQMTEAIRAEEAADVGVGRTPIIAITANALQGEADRCLAVGMDEYLVKPLEMARLKRALSKWIPAVSADDGTVTGLPPSKIALEPAVSGGLPPPTVADTVANDEANGEVDDEASDGADGEPDVGLDPIQSLGAGGTVDPTYLRETFGDDPDLIRGILKDFVAPARAIQTDLEAAFAAEDTAAVAAAAHKLKSSSRAVGAMALADLCQDLEAAGKSGDYQALQARHGELAGLVTQVTAAIEHL